MKDKARVFLDKYGMSADNVQPDKYYFALMDEMEKGLAGKESDLAMYPTYLSLGGEVPENTPVIVIDAGGTNYRCALLSYNNGQFETLYSWKSKMPGTGTPVTWDAFIDFTADSLEPVIEKSDYIGFCFSYDTRITSDMDGVVKAIDKEVVIMGAEGKKLGRCLTEKLAERGYPNKKVVILNDTVAVLLGASAMADKSKHSGFIGQVSGTGTNTCFLIKSDRIGKISDASSDSMIINTEVCGFKGLPRGVFDIELDELYSKVNGRYFEKMTAGAYLGQIARLMIVKAFDDGCISMETLENIRALGVFDTSAVSRWTENDNFTGVKSAEDFEFICDISRALIERSAKSMCTNILATLMLTGTGNSPKQPAFLAAEGSLVQKCAYYKENLEKYFDVYCREMFGKYISFTVTEGTTLTGAAAAALLNL